MTILQHIIEHTRPQTVDQLIDQLPVQKEILDIIRSKKLQSGEGALRLHIFHDLESRFPGLSKIVHELETITSMLNPVELCTVDGFTQLQEHFLSTVEAGKTPANPRFHYHHSLRTIKNTLAHYGYSPTFIERRLDLLLAMTRQYSSSEPEVQLLKHMIEQKILDDYKTLLLLEGLEQESDILVRNALSDKYGGPVTQELHRAALCVEDFLHHVSAPQMHPYMHEHVHMEHFKDAVEWVLEYYYSYYERRFGRPFPKDLRFRVRIDHHCTNIDVRDKSAFGPEIVLPTRSMNLYRMLHLLRHEIDGHVRQSLNGYSHFRVAGGAMKIDDEIWYEGIAMYKETLFSKELFNDHSKVPAPYYIFGIAAAERGASFVEVFMLLREKMHSDALPEDVLNERVFKTTYRIFRGHLDTGNSKAYAFRKDQAYLRGWILQSQLDILSLGYLSESTICKVNGLHHFLGAPLEEDTLAFPDLNGAVRYMEAHGLL